MRKRVEFPAELRDADRTVEAQLFAIADDFQAIALEALRQWDRSVRRGIFYSLAMLVVGFLLGGWLV